MDAVSTPTCKKCGATNLSSKGVCRPCAALRSAEWRAANPDRAKAVKLAWNSANKEKKKASRAEYLIKYPGRQKESSAKWRKNNPEKAKECARSHYEKNSKEIIAKAVQWEKSHPETYRSYKQNRRAKKLNSAGSLSTGLREKLFKMQKGLCACCKLPLGDNFHMDHIVPLALGGTNTDDNIQLLRSKCNCQKGASHPVDFMQRRGFLL